MLTLYGYDVFRSFLRHFLGFGELSGSPPTIWVDRNWMVDSTAPVGSVVARVRVSDVGNETDLQYGLEHSTGFNIVQMNEEPLPFTIDKNGKVTTNTSLANKVNVITIIKRKPPDGCVFVVIIIIIMANSIARTRQYPET